MSDSGYTKECCGAGVGHDRNCPQVKRDLLDAVLAEAVEIKLKDGSRLIRYVDGKWIGAAATLPQTKMRYDLIIDAYQALKKEQ